MVDRDSHPEKFLSNIITAYISTLNSQPEDRRDASLAMIAALKAFREDATYDQDLRGRTLFDALNYIIRECESLRNG